MDQTPQGTSNTRTFGLVAAIGIGAVVFGIAFVVAPYSCDGGLEFYFWFGVAALVVLLALPFVLRTNHSVRIRLAWGIGFAIFGAGAWLAGMFAAPVRILCRLV